MEITGVVLKFNGRIASNVLKHGYISVTRAVMPAASTASTGVVAAAATATVVPAAATETIMGVGSGVDRRKQCGDSEEFLDDRGHSFVCCLRKKDSIGRGVRIRLINLKEAANEASFWIHHDRIIVPGVLRNEIRFDLIL
jgi:hypothetical protein